MIKSGRDLRTERQKGMPNRRLALQWLRTLKNIWKTTNREKMKQRLTYKKLGCEKNLDIKSLLQI